MRKRRAIATFSLAVLLHEAGDVHAQGTAALSLEWSAPPGCAAGDEVRRRAEGLLGGAIEPRLRHALSARGTVTEANGRFSLRLETVDDGLPGERNLESESCDELASATALIIALAVDPKAVADRTATSGAPSSTSSPPPVAAPESAVVAPPSQPATAAPAPDGGQRAVRITGYVDVGVAVDLGALPGFAIGPALSGALGVDRVRLRLGATYFAPRFADSPDATSHGTRGADVSLLVGAFSGCYVLVQRAQVSACAEFEGGALFASGTGFQQPRDATNAWLAAGLSAEAVVALAGPLTLRAALGAVFPFGRSRVQFDEKTGNVSDIHVLHQPFWISGRGTLALGIAFW